MRPGDVEVHAATEADLPFLHAVDGHLPDAGVTEAVAQRRVLVAVAGSERIGFVRWGLLWDEVPFMHLLWVVPERRAAGVGTAVVGAWEDLHRVAGHTLVLTSTSAAEPAQHFYRRLGYADSGSFVLPGEPAELVLMKVLA